jgi:SseB protein N-terminal domain
MRPQLLPLTRSHQHATYLRRLHPVPPSTVWVVPFPAAGESPFRDDDGSAEPRVAAALAAFGSGQGSEHAALTALASSRLLVPIVAAAPGADGEARSPGLSRPDGEPPRPGHPRPDGGDSGAEMSLPTLVGRDGRRAIPAFTCSQALTMWRRQARPVPAFAAQVWRAAAEDECAVIVDVAGPAPIAIDGARLAALAGGRPVPLPHEDPDVLAAVHAAADAQPEIAALSAGAPVGGCDLQLNVTLAEGCAIAAGQEAVSRLAAGVMNTLGGRLRRGIAVAVTPSAPAAGRPRP